VDSHSQEYYFSMPRRLFMREKSIYALLFELLENPSEIQDIVWEVLRRLPPSSDLLE